MKRRFVLFPFTVVLLILLTSVVFAEELPENYDFSTPLFGLTAAPDGSLLVADAGAGIVELRNGEGSLVAELPGATDVASIGRGAMVAITGGGEDPGAAMLYRLSRGQVKEFADLAAFEADVNPDNGEIDSNPYGVAVLNGGSFLVADAGGNSLLTIDRQGNVDWVATLPAELASVDHVQALLGCPNPELPPELAGICFIPPGTEVPAEAVATSVAVGPDGAYYVGELKGFPAPVGMSRVWRIEPGTLHAECGTDPACTVVFDDFTSIVDLDFGPDGTLYVVELDEDSWAAVELAGSLAGGTVNACDVAAGTCTEVATGLTIPTAVAVDKWGNLYAAVESLLPSAHVISLP